jgi:hypothetical protein
MISGLNFKTTRAFLLDRRSDPFFSSYHFFTDKIVTFFSFISPRNQESLRLFVLGTIRTKQLPNSFKVLGNSQQWVNFSLTIHSINIY